jgi:pimeloyl-ACP methyl ester carboxylesterase
MKFEHLRRFDFVRHGLMLAAYDSGGDGLPVVFQHGLCGDARQTAEAFPDDPRFRLITLECRGHGASQAGTNFSIATFADDVAALIEHLELAPVVVGGISMGAALSSRLAALRPDLIRGLILARPAWATEAAPDNMRPNLEVGELLAGAIQESGSSSVELSMRSVSVPPPLTPPHKGEGDSPACPLGLNLQRFGDEEHAAAPPPPCGEGLGVGVSRAALDDARARFVEGETARILAADAPDNLASLLSFFDRESRASTSALLRAISRDGPGINEAELRGLNVPTLVLATDQDAIHPPALAEKLASLIPGAMLWKLTPKGVDKPAYLADFHAALATFLKDIQNA